MTAHRINVIGASGSGASTIAQSLAAALALPCFDADHYYHAPSDPPFQHPRDAQERCALLLRDLSAQRGWVLGGGVAGWVPDPQLRFTCLVFLYAPAHLRFARLRQRERARFGSRILPGGDMHKQHQDFLHWASRYDAGDVDGKTLQRQSHYLSQQTCPVLYYLSTATPDTLTTSILTRLPHPKPRHPDSSASHKKPLLKPRHPDFTNTHTKTQTPCFRPLPH